MSLQVGRPRELLVTFGASEIVNCMFVLHVSVQRTSTLVRFPTALKQAKLQVYHFCTGTNAVEQNLREDTKGGTEGTFIHDQQHNNKV